MDRLLRILLFSVILLTCIPNAVAEKFRVTDEYVTVFADGDRIAKLGRIHRGEVYEAIGQDGSMYVFKYKGRKAYVASYCCQIVEGNEVPTSAVETEKQGRTAPSQRQAQQQTASVENPETPADVADSRDNESNVTIESIDNPVHGRNSNAGINIAGWLSKTIGILLLLCFLIGAWSIFGPISCDNFFDNLAGDRVTYCSTATYFRPLIIVFVTGLVFGLTWNINITLAAATIYEIILLGFRAKKLHGLRPAIVEALYLVFHGVGQIIFCWMFLMQFALASGSGSSGSSKGKDPNRCCGRCKYFQKGTPNDICTFHYGQTVYPNDTPDCFKP